MYRNVNNEHTPTNQNFNTKATNTTCTNPLTSSSSSTLLSLTSPSSISSHHHYHQPHSDKPSHSPRSQKSSPSFPVCPCLRIAEREGVQAAVECFGCCCCFYCRWPNLLSKAADLLSKAVDATAATDSRQGSASKVCARQGIALC